MNKTVNMNLGGYFFHIDEDAYQKLNRYFDAIKRSLSDEARDEIMSDIESRISELFSEKLQNNKQVLSLSDVDDVIAIMGQPEDYKIEDENNGNQANYAYSGTGRSKKLYRDKDTGIVAGVCSGLGHYFGVDPVWIRIILVLLVFAGFGTGILAYIILWAVTPEAVTTSEKLEMTGEPITISNIEKKVKEEFEGVSEKFKNADYGQMGSHVKTGAQKVGSSIGDILVTLMKVFAKAVGAFIVLISSVTIISLLISLFTLRSTSFSDVPWIEYFNSFNYTDTSLWFIALMFFLAIGIPFFFLLLLGLKILVNNLKSIGNIAKYTLLGVWIVAVGIIITLSVRTASEVAFDNKVVEKAVINITPADTLKVKFVHNDFYTKDINHRDEFRLVEDQAGQESIYSNDVDFEIMPTDEKQPYVQIEKNANGSSFSEAKKKAEKIRYNFKIEGNQLILDNYFLTEAKSKYRGQEVTIYLYVPKGTYLKLDESVQDYDVSDNDFFNLHYSSDDYVYKVEEEKVKCLNCPADEDEWDDTDQEHKIIIDEDGVTIEKDTVISNSKEIKELKINEDGIIIKTK
ncbi:PspC domain-containing protein [Flavobacterium amniphilum]|uniref:PspC domain-containing protein n=1 Tax=Flavobacterium amniphilum TaxID=1834035 RepID=UPI00202A4E13|nr:PspC domain-containing protein [Flavobacterium amniphilum]MCL9805006.1 PspC domain-containing protein [Flavobacterium amniphilum]